MATLALATYQYQRIHYKFKRYKHIVHIDAGLIHKRTSTTAAPVKGQPAQKQKPNWKFQFMHLKPLCRETLLNEASGYQPIPLDSRTYAYLLQASTSTESLKQIHAHILACGLDQNIFLGTKLVNMYAMWGSMEGARLVFDNINRRNVFLWNAMIRGYATYQLCEEALALFYQMQLTGMKPDKFTFTFVLKACAGLSALQEGKEIHAHICRTGCESDRYVGNSLVDMYAKCGVIEIAWQLFDKMSKRDVISWNAMIAGYVQNGHDVEALALFNQMQHGDIKPNYVTLLSVLQACANSGGLQQGKWIHAYMIHSGFELDTFVVNSLIDMYAKCGSVEMARQLFDEMSKRNVVSWSAMVAGYAQIGCMNEALRLFNQMQLVGVMPNSFTMVSVLQACTDLGAMQLGKCIHDYIIKRGIESDVFVGNSLIYMYAKCGNVEHARQILEKMCRRNVVSWNALIAGYAQNGCANETLTLFYQMQVSNMKPNEVTIVSVLQAFTYSAALQQGKWIHGYIIRSGFESNVFVGNSLVHMYAKCGCVETASQLFDKMSKRDVVSWSSMIAGYGMHGHGEDALTLFHQMQQAGMKPNHITFVCVLSACSHAGLVDEGWQHFDCMVRDYCITPRVEHYACMVDLLGRAGKLCEAQNLIEKMQLEPSASVWGALLSACKLHCNVKLGEQVAKHIFDIDPENVGCYILLSNIYAAAGKWDDATKVKKMMKDRGLKKIPGCSLIEVNKSVNTFLVGDRSHPYSDKIYAMSETLAGQMKNVDYVPHTDFVLHNMEEEVKECMLCCHNEMLPTGFGIFVRSSSLPTQTSAKP
eukprot:Gb_00195 [translate_table: standard]